MGLMARLFGFGQRSAAPQRVFAGDPFLALSDAQPRRRWEAAAALRDTPELEHAIPALAQALNDTEPFVRWQAGQSLIMIASNEAWEALSAALRSPSPLPRAAAAEALGQSGWPQVIPLLTEALTDQDAGVRVAAALALGCLRRAEGAPYLAAALQTETSPGVRWAITRALGLVGVPLGAEALHTCLTNQWEETPVRRSAVWAAGRMGWEMAAMAALLAALEDGDAQVRWQACLGLGHVTQATLRAGSVDRAAVDQIREALGRLRGDSANAGSESVGEAAERALAQIDAGLRAQSRRR